MNVDEIKEVVKCFDASQSIYMEVKQGDLSLTLKKAEAGLEERAIGETIAMGSGLEAITLSNTSGPQIEAQGKSLSPATSPENEQETGTQVKAPLVGVFYAASSPEAEAYVQVGSQVKKGQVLCLIEAMKMMSEVTAPNDGRIEKIYVKNADLVEFDQPLFLIGD